MPSTKKANRDLTPTQPRRRGSPAAAIAGTYVKRETPLELPSESSRTTQSCS